MSRANVEVIRAGLDAFNRGDYDAWLEAFSEDVEVHDLAETPDTGVFHGHAGVRAWLAKLQAAWGDGFRFEPRSFTEGEGGVVADVRASATGVGGGVPIEMRAHLAFRLRDREIMDTGVLGSRRGPRSPGAVGVAGSHRPASQPSSARSSLALSKASISFS